MIINTWVNDELVTLDTDDVWAREFAEWDAMVDTAVAAAIANEVVRVLIEQYSDDEAQS